MDDAQHIVYRGEDGQLHELWFKRGQGWMEGGVADAMPVDAVGDPTAYTWSVDDTQHIIYRGEDDRLCELWFKRAPLSRSCGISNGWRPLRPIRAIDHLETRQILRRNPF